MKNLTTAMTDSIFKTIETMFYLSLELDPQTTIESSHLLSAEKIRVTRLDFTGPFAGFFRLYVPEKLLREMTGNFMGLDIRAITPSDLDGTMKELINMIAGNTLSTLDDALEFQFGLPAIEDPSQIPPLDAAQDTQGICLVPETLNGFLAVQAGIQKP